VQASVLLYVPTRDFHLVSCVFERNSAVIVKLYLSSLESLMGFLSEVVPRTVHMQVVPGGKVSIPGDHSIGHSKKMYVYILYIYIYMFPGSVWV
jgi:hypothetical protein